MSDWSSGVFSSDLGGQACHPQWDSPRLSKSGGGRRPATHVVSAGRRKEWTAGIVNPPVWRASTILYDDVAALDAARHAPDDQPIGRASCRARGGQYV